MSLLKYQILHCNADVMATKIPSKRLLNGWNCKFHRHSHPTILWIGHVYNHAGILLSLYYTSSSATAGYTDVQGKNGPWKITGLLFSWNMQYIANQGTRNLIYFTKQTSKRVSQSSWRNLRNKEERDKECNNIFLCKYLIYIKLLPEIWGKITFPSCYAEIRRRRQLS